MKNQEEMITYYKNKIYDRFNDLINAGKKSEDFDNFDLARIFEYYSCIKLTEETNTLYYHYDDIDQQFKEDNMMSRNDTGIDCCNLIDCIVQCKLRNKTLSWKECDYCKEIIKEEDICHINAYHKYYHQKCYMY